MYVYPLKSSFFLNTFMGFLVVSYFFGVMFLGLNVLIFLLFLDELMTLLFSLSGRSGWGCGRLRTLFFMVYLLMFLVVLLVSLLFMMWFSLNSCLMVYRFVGKWMKSLGMMLFSSFFVVMVLSSISLGNLSSFFGFLFSLQSSLCLSMSLSFSLNSGLFMLLFHLMDLLLFEMVLLMMGLCLDLRLMLMLIKTSNLLLISLESLGQLVAFNSTHLLFCLIHFVEGGLLWLSFSKIHIIISLIKNIVQFISKDALEKWLRFWWFHFFCVFSCLLCKVLLLSDNRGDMLSGICEVISGDLLGTDHS